MPRELWLDPIPDDTLTSLRENDPVAAVRLDEALDWIEADPVDPRATRRRFSNGLWAITVYVNRTDWLVLWEETAEHPVVRFIGQTASL